MPKIVFFGSSSYSVTILQKLLTLPDFVLTTVVTKEDKAVGRSQQITPNPVAAFCQQHQLPVLKPSDFTPEFIDQFRSLKPDLGLCVAYGPPFFTNEMINIPTYKIINIHPSPLPKYRGATPGPWQIINGETKSALSFFVIDQLPDHGPIISQVPLTISPIDTSVTFYQRAFDLAAANLESILTDYLKNPQALTPQDHSQKSYFPKFAKESAKIDWSKDAVYIERFIRGLNPWPVAWTEVINSPGQKFKIKIYSGKIDETNFIPNLVQIEGKKPTSWDQIKDYYSLPSRS